MTRRITKELDPRQKPRGKAKSGAESFTRARFGLPTGWRKTAAGKWYCQATHTTYSKRPRWDESREAKNNILEDSARPQTLRRVYDQLRRKAGALYRKGTIRSDEGVRELRKFAQTVTRMELKADLRSLFKIDLRDEFAQTQNLTIANNFCNQIIELSAIIEALR